MEITSKDILDSAWFIFLMSPVMREAWGWLWEKRHTVVKHFTLHLSVPSVNGKFHLYQVALLKLMRPTKAVKEDNYRSNEPLGAFFETGQPLLPDYGNYRFKFEGVHVLVSYCKGESMEHSSREENIHFTFYTRDQKVLTSFREYVLNLEVERRKEKTSILANLWGAWSPFNMRYPRPESTIFYAGNLHQALKEDLLKFRALAGEYRAKGKVHKRGYLLHGPPGNGKTTLCTWVASQVGMDLATLSCKVGDPRFLDLITTLPKETILVLEDIDVLFTAAKERDFEAQEHCPDTGSSRQLEPRSLSISLSMLLNYLDGMLSQDGQIVLMTTNYPDRLDSALTRRGRADMSLYIGNSTLDTFTRMHQANFDQRPSDRVLSKFESLPCKPSMAALEGLFQSCSLEGVHNELERACDSNKFKGTDGDG